MKNQSRDNINIVSPLIENYLNHLLPARDALFEEIEHKADSEGFPIVGPHMGNLLQLLAAATNANKVLELGSGYGYSGLWFAKGMQSNGQLILTDLTEENRNLALEYFKRAGLNHIMEFRVGESIEILKQETGPFDIIFNDIDKEDYPKVIHLSYERLRSGGLFITDNTLWYGKVVQPNPDSTTKAIQEFNANLKDHKGFHTVHVPIRDGISVSIKS